MRRKRTRYQFGSVQLVKRKTGPAVWKFRYFDTTDGGRTRRAEVIGTVEQYPDRNAALKGAEYLRMRANPEQVTRVWTFGALVDRYKAEELPARHSTRALHLSYLNNYIRPRWGEYALTAVRPHGVEQWIRSLPLSPKSRNTVKSIMSVLFACAMRWELINSFENANPMRLVRVPDGSKRAKKPRSLTVEEVQALLYELEKCSPACHMMALLGVCLGLRASEIVGLKWGDFNFDRLTVHVQRAVVGAFEGEVKTSTSEERLPIDRQLADELLRWKASTPWQTEQDWVFASPVSNGAAPYRHHSLRTVWLQPAALRAGVGRLSGWHALRHTYSTLLHHLEVPLKVQQTLMRHADARTTMNVYTDAVGEDLRSAHNMVVREVMPPRLM